MKLLTKREVDTAKAKDRQIEIQEGVKLASRVDSLREVMATEEQKLEEFRVKTLANIHKETTEAGNVRDTLVREVADLEKRKKEALEPVTKELAHLETVQKLVFAEQQAVHQRASQLQLQEQTVDKIKQEAQNELQRIENEHKKTSSLLKDADSKEKQAQTTLINAQKIEGSITALKVEVEQDLRIRDEGIAAKERSLLLKLEKVDERELELNKRERRLLDREQTLERELNRLKKQNATNSKN